MNIDLNNVLGIIDTEKKFVLTSSFEVFNAIRHDCLTKGTFNTMLRSLEAEALYDPDYDYDENVECFYIGTNKFVIHDYCKNMIPISMKTKARIRLAAMSATSLPTGRYYVDPNNCIVNYDAFADKIAEKDEEAIRSFSNYDGKLFDYKETKREKRIRHSRRADGIRKDTAKHGYNGNSRYEGRHGWKGYGYQQSSMAEARAEEDKSLWFLK